MTEAQLRNKITDVELRLYQSQLDDHKRSSSIGWGYGFRGYRRLRDFKTARSDKLVGQLENLKNQLYMQPADMEEFENYYVGRIKEFCENYNHSSLNSKQIQKIFTERKNEILQRLKDSHNTEFVKIKDRFFFCISLERGKKEFEAIF